MAQAFPPCRAPAFPCGWRPGVMGMAFCFCPGGVGSWLPCCWRWWIPAGQPGGVVVLGVGRARACPHPLLVLALLTVGMVRQVVGPGHGRVPIPAALPAGCRRCCAQPWVPSGRSPSLLFGLVVRLSGMFCSRPPSAALC